MKLSVLLAVFGIDLICCAIALGQIAEPTKTEIADAYRSKVAEGGAVIPGIRWEKRRINQIRGWSLKFKRLHEDRAIGILILRYHALARKNLSCAEYQIIQTIPLTPGTPHIRPSLTVEPGGVTACR
jgi:hypothetical protein